MSKQPYKLAGLEGYEPAQPWAQPIASAQMSKLDSQENLPFLSLAEMDNDFDGWPDKVNPFLHKEPPQTPEIPIPDQPILITTAIPLRTVQKLIADIIQSEDTLFFINHSVTATEGRKEWKLIQVNFEKSIQQQPACLQNGRFLVDFYIEHHQDKSLDIRDRSFWLEYHKSNSHKTISTQYHILQPSQFSSKTATDKDLVPYREWLNLSDPTTLSGPFEFATINQRKTRDRVSSTDWSQLQSMQAKYDNQAPVLRNHNFLVDVSQPVYEVIAKDSEISARCTAFMGKLELNDKTLAQYRHPVRP
jgi:hypothetical protein